MLAALTLLLLTEAGVPPWAARRLTPAQLEALNEAYLFREAKRLGVEPMELEQQGLMELPQSPEEREAWAARAEARLAEAGQGGAPARAQEVARG